MTKLLINCGLTQNSHCIQEILLKVSILKEDYQKAWKKVTLFFSQTQSLLIDKLIKNKGLELVTSRSSGYKTSSEKFLY